MPPALTSLLSFVEPDLYPEHNVPLSVGQIADDFEALKSQVRESSGQMFLILQTVNIYKRMS